MELSNTNRRVAVVSLYRDQQEIKSLGAESVAIKKTKQHLIADFAQFAAFV